MIGWTFLLTVAGRPYTTAVTVGRLRAAILEMPDDDVESMAIWELRPESSALSPEDITKAFAQSWAAAFDYGGGIEPADYLAPFPAFVRHHHGAELIAEWQDQTQTVTIGDFRRQMPKRQAESLKLVAMQMGVARG